MITKNYKLLRKLEFKKEFDFFLAEELNNKKEVFIKANKEFLTDQRSLESLENEFLILKNLKHENIIEVKDFQKQNNKCFLVLDSFNQMTLKLKIENKKLDLYSFLSIAINLCEVCYYLHEKNIIYQNFTTSSILINEKTNEIKLFDFSESKEISKIKSIKKTSNNTDIYKAPEQTSRINFSITEQTDIYSLGIVFYEMLSGVVPYDSKDLLSLSHTIITKEFLSLSELDFKIPKIISNVIEKMIQKNPIDRYSNILSVLIDLKKIKEQFLKNKSFCTFEIDQFQKNFLINSTKKLFGREEELEELKKSIKNLDNKLLIIKGVSGVGKTSFVKTALQLSDVDTSNLLEIKLDNYKQNIAYKILYEKIRELSKQLLTKDSYTLNSWKKSISNSLGSEAKILYELIPELKIILNDNSNKKINNEEISKIEFDNYLFKYLQLFATSKNPLFIFIDDMQWSDEITRTWLESALYQLKNTIIIITYRNNEVKENSRLYKLLNKLKKDDIKLKTFHLKPLKLEDIKNILKTNIKLENSNEVAKLIFSKTSGNCFFIIQLLKQLLDEEIIYFNYEQFKWKCDLNQLNTVSASNNIIELLENKINKLDKDENRLLKIASCIGNKFDEELLKNIYNDDINFKQTLNKTILNEWIVKSKNINNYEYEKYKFSHDRIQQVIYNSIILNERSSYHKKIADSILSLNLHKKNNDYLTYINHYNNAKTLFKTKEQKDYLAALNYKASINARENADFIMALKYMKEALNLYSDIKSKDNYSEILKDYAICEHMVLNKKTALKYYNKAINAAITNLEKAYIYEQIIKLYSDFSEFKNAYETGKEALELFDLNIPKEFSKVIYAKDSIYLKYKLKTKNPNSLLSLPQAKDEKIVIMIKILSALLKAAYQIDPKLCVLVSMKLVKLCLKHGDTKDAVIGFMVFGVIFQGAIKQNHKLGYKYANLSLDMIKKYNNTTLYPEVNFVSGYFAFSWLLPTAITEQKWFESYNKGLLIGDLFHSGCATAGIIQSMFLRGVCLDNINKQIDKFEKTLRRIKAYEQLGAILSVKQTIANLKAQTIDKNSFCNKYFDEDEYVKSLENYNSLHFAHYYYINKTIALFIHEDYKQAYEYYLQSKRFLEISKGTIHGLEHYFYESLLFSNLYEKVNDGLKKRYLNTIKKNLLEFEKYSLECPENFLVRKNLIKAEIYRIENKINEAFKYFEKAIEAAEIYSQTHLKAIANRLLSNIYKKINQERVSKLLKKQEQEALVQWGVLIKESSNSSNNSSESINFNTLTKAAEAIVKEQKLPNLLKNLLHIILEKSGAQYANVLLEDNNKYYIQATASYKSINIDVMQNIEFEKSNNIVHNVINYVLRTKKPIVIDDLNNNSIFIKENDAISRGVKSVLCLPLIFHNKIRGLIYLENNAMSGVFSKEQIELLKHLSGQIAISIENAIMYKNLEQKVAERTKALDKKNDELENQNIKLQLQNRKILELNSDIIKENEKRKEVEKELQEAVKKLDMLATVDSLTNIKNRRVFDTYIEQECARVQRTKESLCLIMCDIDYFKLYNDYYGHLQGDECLKYVAKILNDNLKRTNDLVARYGGEEFAIILPNTSIKNAHIIATEIKSNIDNLKIAHEKSKVSTYITLSMGIASSKEIKNITPKNLIRLADEKLYLAKNKGRNQII
ncbi:diguanylate cyclase (GGDEF)-like protein [Malaciobacter marinus]|uniref:Diguanylate cyclase (GGDEF)-like protein n=1 Tax=Malaciobacter marinus TaxID=505249 RepID=A0AB36ZTY9_9BACT|nr:diguanylate cyclase [Malaciobacter marinus]PPK58540.1 diguanylate cyclase (GGDEF)-like protein [Malaciobacter marinus]